MITTEEYAEMAESEESLVIR